MNEIPLARSHSLDPPVVPQVPPFRPLPIIVTSTEAGELADLVRVLDEFGKENGITGLETLGVVDMLPRTARSARSCDPYRNFHIVFFCDANDVQNRVATA